MAATIRFTKIKFIKGKGDEGGGDKVLLEYQRKNPGGAFDNVSEENSDEPKPGFNKCLSELAPFVVQLCELPKTYVGRISVNGVAFCYGGDSDIMSAMILGKMNLQNSKGTITLNTPYKAEKPLSDVAIKGAGSDVLPVEALIVIKKLIVEAKAYMKGERLQVKLELKDKNEPEGKD